jgi:hypothetical protein
MKGEKPVQVEFVKAVVDEVLESGCGKTVCRLNIDHPIKQAIGYDFLTGTISANDVVIVNTTAASLKLGTGGFHFIMANTQLEKQMITGKGHCMKLKYTPLQLKVLTAEEADSPHHQWYDNPVDFKGKLVYIGELHSMIAPLCAYLKYYSRDSLKIAYVMNDHGALPLHFSISAAVLKHKGLIDVTITSGNAFGGDYECINIYTSLRTALNVTDCDAAIIASGPGICGTATKYGFSTLESALYTEMVASLGGNILYIPRIGFSDSRKRHSGISHHSLTILGEFVFKRLKLALPLLNDDELKIILRQLRMSCLCRKHSVVMLNGRDIHEAMAFYGLKTETMGRSIDDNPAFFNAIGAAGKLGLRILNIKNRTRHN